MIQCTHVRMLRTEAEEASDAQYRGRVGAGSLASRASMRQNLNLGDGENRLTSVCLLFM